MRHPGERFAGRNSFFGAFAALAVCGPILSAPSPVRAAQAGWPEDGLRGRGVSLPTDPATWRFVRSESADAPPGLRALSEGTGVPWSAVWDFGLDVPLTAYPRGPVAIMDPPPALRFDFEAERAASAFINRYRDVFGLGTEKLGPLEVFPFKPGRLVIAVQGHANVPVRGSILRLMIDGEGKLLSISATLAKNLPPMDPVRFDYSQFLEWKRQLKQLDGLEAVIWLKPQILFPSGLSNPVAGVSAVGLDAEGREFEVFRRLADRELLLRRETTNHFGGADSGKGADDDDFCVGRLMITARIDGYYPPPADPHCLPFHYDPRDGPRPVAGYKVWVESADPCTVFLEMYGFEDGTRRGGLGKIHPRKRRVWIGLATRSFHLAGGHPDYLGVGFENPPEEFEYRKTFNEGGSEWEAFQLFVFSHIHRAVQAMWKVASPLGLRYAAWEDLGNSSPVYLELGRHHYRHMPYTGTFVFGMKVGEEKDADGRWEKIAPTIVYHEWGHELIFRVANATGHFGVLEGIADAFAAYVGDTSFLGFGYARFGDELKPVADPAARDLAEDSSPARYSGDARRAIAGALWELKTSLSRYDKDGSGEGTRLALTILIRWLASLQGSKEWDPGATTIEYHPTIGFGLLDLARKIVPDPEKTELDNATLRRVIVEILGKRNLYPAGFIRGDADGDGVCRITDAVRIIRYLFAGESEVPCLEALDANDDDSINVTDPVRLLGHLFLGKGPLPAPFPACGPDPRFESGYGCGSSSCGEF